MRQYWLFRRFFRFTIGRPGSLLGVVLGLAGVLAAAGLAAAGTFPAWLGAILVACVVTSVLVVELELDFRRQVEGDESDERHMRPIH